MRTPKQKRALAYGQALRAIRGIKTNIQKLKKREGVLNYRDDTLYNINIAYDAMKQVEAKIHQHYKSTK